MGLFSKKKTKDDKNKSYDELEKSLDNTNKISKEEQQKLDKISL